jgi:hypothetical protein
MIESLEELLQIDTDGNKAMDNKKLLSKVKQLLKGQNKKEKNLEYKAEELPYEAVSVVGERFVTIKFNIDTKEAVVSDIQVDSRDSGLQNHMASHKAGLRLKALCKEYRNDRGDKNE